MLPGKRPGKKGKTGLCCLKARAEVERARPAVGYGGRRMLLMEGRCGAEISEESGLFLLLMERMKLLSYLSPDSSSKDIAQYHRQLQ